METFNTVEDNISLLTANEVQGQGYDSRIWHYTNVPTQWERNSERKTREKETNKACD